MKKAVLIACLFLGTKLFAQNKADDVKTFTLKR
jgi:hypothetical protein